MGQDTRRKLSNMADQISRARAKSKLTSADRKSDKTYIVNDSMFVIHNGVGRIIHLSFTLLLVIVDTTSMIHDDVTTEDV